MRDPFSGSKDNLGLSLEDGIICVYENTNILFVNNLIAAGCQFYEVNELSAMGSEIHVWPNPSKGVFTIQLLNPEKYKIEVIDMLGNTIFTKQNLSDWETIDLFSKAKGVYLLKFSSIEGKTTFRKIVLN